MSVNYTPLLKWSLGHKRWVLITTLVLLVGSFALVGGGFIGNEFVNMGDRGEMVVKVELPKRCQYPTNQPEDTGSRTIHFYQT